MKLRIMVRCLLVIFVLIECLELRAQTSRIQFIHNSADATLDTIDVYAGGTLIADNLPFRSATAFLTIPAGNEINISIAAKDSEDDVDALRNFPFTPASGIKYILVANGELNEEGYHPFQALSLTTYSGAIETGVSGAGTDILFCNGSTDLPSVDLVETELIQLTAFEDIAYGSISGYQTLLTASYVFDVTNAAQDEVYGTFSAPLDALNLGGKPVTILSSGFFNQAMNQHGAAFGLWLALPTGGALIELPVISTELHARCQLIHNSADEEVDVLDVYLDGELLLDNFSFRTATPFMHLQAGKQVTMAFAHSDSQNAGQAFYSRDLYLYSGESVSMVIDGIVNLGLYNPAVPFELHVFEGVNEFVESGMDIRYLFHHGATDADLVDIVETSLLNLTLADNLAYGNTLGNFELPIMDMILTLRDQEGVNDIASYVAPFNATNPGFLVTIVLSGFEDPQLNNNGPELGLWVAPWEGGALFPLELVPPAPVYSGVQIIHNSADALLSSVDIYLNEELILNDFSFRHATPYLNVQAGIEQVFSIAPFTSMSSTEALATLSYTFSENENQIVVINGILSDVGYNPSPDLSLDVYSGARISALNESETDVMLVHGCTDASSVDITEMSTSTELANDLAFHLFSSYSSFTTGNNYFIHLTNGNGSVDFGEYDLLLNTWNLSDQSATVFLSGFLNPSNNSNGPELELWLASSTGETHPLPVHVGIEESGLAQYWSIYPNPAANHVFINTNGSANEITHVEIFDIAGQCVLETSRFGMKNFTGKLDLSELSDGVYAIVFNDGQSAISKKLVIQK